MSIGIQTIDVINAIDRLNPSDDSIDGPVLDPSILSMTYPIDAGGVGLRTAAYSGNTTSIHGSTHSLVDTVVTGWGNGGNPPTTPPTSMFSVANNRALTWRVKLAGGPPSPIRIRLSWLSPSVGGYDYLEVDVPNPGVLSAGPFLVPFGWQGRMNCAAGGAGDTVAPDIIGWEAAPGVPLPGVNPYVVVSG